MRSVYCALLAVVEVIDVTVEVIDVAVEVVDVTVEVIDVTGYLQYLFHRISLGQVT